MMAPQQASIERAAEVIRNSDALLIGAGAGMGVDSGLPDFRGPEGFWKAYPPFRGRMFSEVSTPHWFNTDPEMAWGFFGHRLNLYRSAVPHNGFHILHRWGERMPLGCFVYTSNVDGQFQKAGFGDSQILERHGSVHFLQCTGKCGRPIWPAAAVHIDVDETTIRAQLPLPVCPDCESVVRPNILMFGDWDWDPDRCELQHVNYANWLAKAEGKRIVAIEIGAGVAIPTVRIECEKQGAVLIRINPTESDTPDGGISIRMGGLAAIESLDQALRSS